MEVIPERKLGVEPEILEIINTSNIPSTPAAKPNSIKMTYIFLHFVSKVKIGGGQFTAYIYYHPGLHLGEVTKISKDIILTEIYGCLLVYYLFE